MTTESARSANASVWSLRNEYWYDRLAARKAVCFFENEIRHVKGPMAGRKLKLERWQRSFIRRLYGWKVRQEGVPRDQWLRKHKVAFLFIARKNGKSLLGAGIALYGLFADGELGAEVISAAVDRKQAQIIFDVAKQMVELNPKLQKRCKLYQKSIVIKRTASVYTVASADVKNKHGENSSTVVFDELHTQPNGELNSVLKTGVAARAQPIIAYFTTAGVYDENSICYEYYQKAKRCIEDIWHDPSWLPVVYEADSDDEWTSEDTWRKANPNLGISVRWDYIRTAFRDAQMNMREQNAFRRLHLNQWTMQLERWLDMEQWRACGAKRSFDESEFYGRVCVGGLDLSRKIDVTAFVLLFKEDDDVIAIPRFFCPQASIVRRSERDNVPYMEWAQEGYLIATPGETIDYDVILNEIEDLNRKFIIDEIAYDPWGGEAIATPLVERGFQMIELSQSFGNLSEPCKELEGLLADTRFLHNQHPILTWMANNAACKEDDRGNIMPSKKLSKEKIDGISATINALNRLIVHLDAPVSRYEKDGFTFF